jgi:hypothetical protein
MSYPTKQAGHRHFVDMGRQVPRICLAAFRPSRSSILIGVITRSEEVSLHRSAGLRRGHDFVPEFSQRFFQVGEALLVAHISMKHGQLVKARGNCSSAWIRSGWTGQTNLR